MEEWERCSRPQVVTELDSWVAQMDYIRAQLLGRFLLEFPEQEEIIRTMAHQLLDPQMRETVDRMKTALESTAGNFGFRLTKCLLNGCDEDTQHAFLRAFIELIWDSSKLTSDWLKGQGIVPGWSVN